MNVNKMLFLLLFASIFLACGGENNQNRSRDENSTTTTFVDTIAPLKPTLIKSKIESNQDDFETVTVSGEIGTELYINEKFSIMMASEKEEIKVDISGEDGVKSFSFYLQDRAGNRSEESRLIIDKDTTAPSFSLTSIKVKENQKKVFKVEAKDEHNISYRLTGEDAKLFLIDKKSGLISFKENPDYESIAHSFIVTVIAEDSFHNKRSQTLTISLLDEDENSTDESNTDDNRTNENSNNNNDSNNSIKNSLTRVSKLLDNEVSGVSYECIGFSGLTEDGAFKFNNNCGLITFRIGDIIIGKIQALKLLNDGKLYINELLGKSREDVKDKKVVKVLQLLQSLDDDGDPSNGIVIPKKAHQILLKQEVDFSKESPTTEKIIEIVEEMGKELISEEDATKHFTEVLKENGDIKSYTITSTANSGGSISPTSQTVGFQERATFTITPNSGYKINKVSGCDGHLNGNRYTTDSMESDCFISATFLLNRVDNQKYTITTKANSGGAISPTTQTIGFQERATFTLTPDSGYRLERVSGCDGHLNGNRYTTDSMESDCHISAIFIKDNTNGKKYTITTKSSSGGSISPTVQTVGFQERATFTLTPDSGYELDKVSGCYGHLVGKNSYVTDSMESGCQVVVKFKKKPKTTQKYTIKATAKKGGSINPSIKRVKEGDKTTFIIKPNSGYTINQVTGCGGSLNGDRYTTKAITADCNVVADFSIIPPPTSTTKYTVTATANSGGSITPSTQSVASGTTTTFTITPNSGYIISSVTGCGGTLNGNSYTTGAVTADCSVTANFSSNGGSANTYTITASTTGGGGSITPASQIVGFQQRATFTLTPDSGYRLDTVSGCWGHLSGNDYITDAMESSCHVTATFISSNTPDYTVTATANSGGYITPSSQTVTSGKTTTFTITPNSGYTINSVTGCGGSLNGNSYTTGAVTADCSVTADFILLNSNFTVTALSTGNGSITPLTQSVASGSATTFTVTPNSGYEIQSVTGCGGTLSGNIYTTTAVTKQCSVVASFMLSTPTTQSLPQLKSATGLDNPSLAYNIIEINDWAPAMPFLDIVKFSRPFQASNWSGSASMENYELKAGGYLDANGWPTSIPLGMDMVSMLWGWNNTDNRAGESRKGRYVLTYEGEGTVDVAVYNDPNIPGADGKIVSQVPGKIVFDIGAFNDTPSVRIYATDPNHNGNYVRNIKIVKEKYLDLYNAGEIFNPEWIAIIKDIRQGRFMGMIGINTLKIKTWAEQKKFDDQTWFQNAPIEVQVRLANEVGFDPWFNIPHYVDDNYVQKFATYVRDHLDPKLVATVEYSNEVWNWGFSHTKDTQNMADALWGLDRNSSNYDGTAWLQYYGMRSSQIMKIWSTVFGSETSTRLQRVLGIQTPTDDYWLSKMLDAPLWQQNDPTNYEQPAQYFDAIATTYYFGHKVIVDDNFRNAYLNAVKDTTVDNNDYLYRLLTGKISGFGNHLQEDIDEIRSATPLIKKRNLKHLFYEGGQHVHHSAFTNVSQADLQLLKSALVAFSRSQEMANIYQEHWNAWKTMGMDGPYMQFKAIEETSIYGSWGLIESLLDTTPRYTLLNQLNQTTPAWWEGRGGEHFQNGVIEYGTSGDDTLIGTNQEDFFIGKAGNDKFYGGMGNDGINGGDGNDTAIFKGDSSLYTIVDNNGSYQVTGPDGSDYLYDVEQLEFADRTILI